MRKKRDFENEFERSKTSSEVERGVRVFIEWLKAGKLDHVIAKGTDKYSYVFIDEAHRFRNSDTNSFTLLHQICRGKKVILISATPVNNYSSDIENQLYLFQPKQGGTIGGIRNIGASSGGSTAS